MELDSSALPGGRRAWAPVHRRLRRRKPGRFQRRAECPALEPRTPTHDFGDAMTNRSQFGHDTTTEEVLEGIDLSGRVALVTGASGGLGAEAARALASRGARVTLAARDAAKTEAVMAEIVGRHPGAVLEHRDLELSEPARVRRFAEGWLEAHDSLHMLVLNAGLMACPLARTAEGWELQFATNHLGHFLLANLLAPALLAAARAYDSHGSGIRDQRI